MSSLLVSSVIMRLSIGSGTLIMLFVITSSMQSLYIMSGLLCKTELRTLNNYAIANFYTNWSLFYLEVDVHVKSLSALAPSRGHCRVE